MPPFNLVNSVSVLADISALYANLRFFLPLPFSLILSLLSSAFYFHFDIITLISYKKMYDFTRKSLTSQ